MVVHGLSDIWLGAIVTLNDGRKVEVVGQDGIPESQKHETVMVSDGTNEFPVIVGEGIDPVWIAEVKTEDNPTPACEELEPVGNGVSYFDEIFDGIDPETFDGDF